MPEVKKAIVMLHWECDHCGGPCDPTEQVVVQDFVQDGFPWHGATYGQECQVCKDISYQPINYPIEEIRPED